LKTAEG